MRRNSALSAPTTCGDSPFGPASQNGSYVRIQSFTKPIVDLTPETANFQTPGLSWAQYGRFVTIQDAPYYYLVFSSPDVFDEYDGSRRRFLTAYSISRQVNHFIEQNGQMVHEVGPYFGFSYRGSLTPAQIDMVNYNVILSSPCMNGMQYAPRPMTEIPGTLGGTN